MRTCPTSATRKRCNIRVLTVLPVALTARIEYFTQKYMPPKDRVIPYSRLLEFAAHTRRVCTNIHALAVRIAVVCRRHCAAVKPGGAFCVPARLVYDDGEVSAWWRSKKWPTVIFARVKQSGKWILFRKDGTAAWNCRPSSMRSVARFKCFQRGGNTYWVLFNAVAIGWLIYGFIRFQFIFIKLSFFSIYFWILAT